MDRKLSRRQILGGAIGGFFAWLGAKALPTPLGAANEAVPALPPAESAGNEAVPMLTAIENDGLTTTVIHNDTVCLQHTTDNLTVTCFHDGTVEPAIEIWK